MSKESDTQESFLVIGNLSVLPNTDSPNNPGNVEISGTMYVDAINPNTTDGSVNLEETLFRNGSINLKGLSEIPTAIPGLTFFIKNNFLCSINSTGIITTYQPLTKTGDTLIYNKEKNTQDSLSVGPDTSVLIADSTTSGGVRWSKNGGNPLRSLFINSGIPCMVVEYPTGSWLTSVYGEKGCGNFINTKASPSEIGVSAKMSSTSINLKTNWGIYNGIDVETLDDGDYKILTSTQESSLEITLTGEVGTVCNQKTFGTVFLSVSKLYGGPACVFLCCKSNSQSTDSIITKICNSSLDGVSLNVSWPLGTGPVLNKSSVSYDGIYTCIDNFVSTPFTATVVLSGTLKTIVPISIFPFYKNKSFFMSVSSVLDNGPCCIYSISKNREIDNETSYSVTSPGTQSLEKIIVSWDPDSLLFINKTGLGYDGEYNVIITRVI